jgi:putative ABC transport system substrate-binding protein
MRGRIGKVATVLLLLSAMLCVDARAARSIAIIYSDSTKQTLRTISGLESKLRESQSDREIKTYFLTGAGENQKPIIVAANPELLVTIGSSSTAFADRAFPNLPIVFAKVLNPIESGFIQSWEQPGSHITGAALDIPAELQLRKFQAMLPGLKKIGVICTKRTYRLVEEARKAAVTLGIQVVSYELTSAKELPVAVDSLCRSVDGIWTVADEELATPQFIRFALLESLRNRIPVMGFNQTFVESGALFCLEADYKYVGIQAAEIAIKILSGSDPAKTKATVSEINYLYLNLKTSKLLNINLPAELVGVAKETY